MCPTSVMSRSIWMTLTCLCLHIQTYKGHSRVETHRRHTHTVLQSCQGLAGRLFFLVGIFWAQNDFFQLHLWVVPLQNSSPSKFHSDLADCSLSAIDWEPIMWACFLSWSFHLLLMCTSYWWWRGRLLISTKSHFNCSLIHSGLNQRAGCVLLVKVTRHLFLGSVASDVWHIVYYCPYLNKTSISN